MTISIKDLQTAALNAGFRDGRARASGRRAGSCPVEGSTFYDTAFQDGPFTQYCRGARVNPISALSNAEVKAAWSQLVSVYTDAFILAYNAAVATV